MKIIWSNTDNQEVIEYVKQHAEEWEFKLHIGGGIGCSCENDLPEVDSPNGNDKLLASLPVYGECIKYIGDRDVEEVFEGIEGIYVIHCKQCGEYAIDIDD